MFLDGKTAHDMEAFIAEYKDTDPENLVPRATIRMRAFAAYEAALEAHQCDQAQRLHRRISGYKVTLPFSYASCKREKSSLGADPTALYVAGVRFEDDGEHANARTLFRAILDRFPQHPIAIKAADRLAHMAELEALEVSRSNGRPTKTTSAPSRPAPLAVPSIDGMSSCPKNLGYIRSRMAFVELRENPSFGEPIEGIIRKAGGLDAAIAELERLIRENQRSLNQAIFTVQQYSQAESAAGGLATRCEKPDGGFCSANYYYHLLKEGEFYYTELLNSLRCRKTGKMEHAVYAPAPIRKPVAPNSPAAARTAPESKIRN